MTKLTFQEQIETHLQFLASLGLSVDELDITGRFGRCRAVAQIKGRANGCYKTTQSDLDNGMIGLVTWARVGGDSHTFRSYGLPLSGEERYKQTETYQYTESPKLSTVDHEQAAKKAYGFWQHSAVEGDSPYLEAKGVLAYGVRFRDSAEYGRTLVVPMRDVEVRLWSYQLIGPDGAKRFPRGARLEGLFHSLRSLIDGQPICISESYATAATCMELSGIACVCCFGCSNIKPVVEALLWKYPTSRLVIFADNDRHLIKNQGLLKAQEAQIMRPDRISLVVPEFGGLEPSKNASDWNDLFRLKGADVCKSQMDNTLGNF